jgi:hypothetical protein
MIQLIHTHLYTPIARVIIPPETVIVKEGSVANPAEIALNLSANSNGFSVSIDVEPTLSNPPRSVTFADGVSQAVSIHVSNMYMYLFNCCTCSPVEH